MVFLILLVLLFWMFCARASRRRQAKAAANAAVVAGDSSGSQANFYYGSHAPYAESIAPSHHSTYGQLRTITTKRLGDAQFLQRNLHER